MPIIGQDVVAANIIKYTRGFIAQTNLVMRNVEAIVSTKIKDNISLTDHSLQQLAQLNHPYSLRNTQQLHDPNYQVHTQSGKLLDSEQSGTVDAEVSESGTLKATAWVKLDPAIAPYAVFIVYGTSKMIPRSVLMGSRDEVTDEIKEYITTNLKNLRISLS